MRFKKGSPEAKRYMAKIRAKKGTTLKNEISQIKKTGKYKKSTETNKSILPVIQRGKSNLKRDSKLKALPPGKRISKTGKKYTETRKNRTDAPGSMTGIMAISGIKDDAMQEIHRLRQFNMNLFGTVVSCEDKLTNKDAYLSPTELRKVSPALKQAIIKNKKMIDLNNKQIERLKKFI